MLLKWTHNDCFIVCYLFIAYFLHLFLFLISPAQPNFLRKNNFSLHNFSTEGKWLSKLSFINLQAGKIKRISYVCILSSTTVLFLSFQLSLSRLQRLCPGALQITKRRQIYDTAIVSLPLNKALSLWNSLIISHQCCSSSIFL